MAYIEDDEEDEKINEDMNKFDELGLMSDSNDSYDKKINSPDDYKYNDYKTSLNYSLDIHKKIKKKLIKDSEEEINENKDAESEDLERRNHNQLNKTLDDLWTLKIYGKRSPEKDSKNFDRILHPVQYGSLKGSIFGLSSMCLGAGSLALAKRCQQFGMVNFLLLLILGALCAYWCLVMMIKAGKNIKEKNYSNVVKIILGKKVGVFIDIIIALFLFGKIVFYQVIIYQMIGAVVYDIMKIAGKLDEKEYDTFINFKEKLWRVKAYLKFPIMFCVAALDFPLCLLKDISKMRIPSLIGVLALVYSIIVVIIESFFYIINENNDKIGKMNWIDITRAFHLKDGIPFFGGVATVFYIYSCHAGAFPIYKTLENNTTRRIKNVFRGSILLDLLVYLFIAASSFITSPLESPDLILFRPNLKGFDPDYFILVAKVGIIFNLFFNTPANYAGFRLSFFELVWGNTNITNTKNIVVTIGILSVVVLIGASYDKILDYIELLGGFCSVIYCVLIPGLLYAKSKDIKKTKLAKYLTIIVVSIILIIGYTSGILTILFQMIKIYPEEKEKK